MNKRHLLGNHQRCWIWGRRLVETTLAAGRWPILELHLSDSLNPGLLEELDRTAAGRKFSLTIASGAEIAKLCRAKDHQGMAAKMAPYPYASQGQALGMPPGSRGPILILDKIQDDYNFGAIVRSGDVFGVQGILIADREQAGVTSMTARASAGAVNHVPICRTSDLPALAQSLGRQNVQIVGATEKGVTNPGAIDWSRPTALIMGNESRGIDPVLLELCDFRAGIPQRPGAVGSLNVAAAAAVLLYEASLKTGRETLLPLHRKH